MTRPTPAAASFLAPPAPARSAELRAGKVSSDHAMPASDAQTGFAANLETRLRGTADGGETTRSEAEFRLLKRKKQAQLSDPPGSGANPLPVPGNFDDRRYHAAPVTTGKDNSGRALPGLPLRTGAGSEPGSRQSASATAGKADWAGPGTLNTDAKHEPDITETGTADPTEPVGQPRVRQSVEQTGAPDSAVGSGLSDEAGPTGLRPNSNAELDTSKDTDHASGAIGAARANAGAVALADPNVNSVADANDPAGLTPGRPATQTLPAGEAAQGDAEPSGHDAATAPSPQLASDDSIPSEPQAGAEPDASGNRAVANEPIAASAASVVNATPMTTTTTTATQATGAGGTIPASRGQADSASRAQVAGNAGVAQASQSKTPETTRATPAPVQQGPAARTEGSSARARSASASTARPQRAAADRTRLARADAASGERTATTDKVAEPKAAAAASAVRPLATDPANPAQSDALSPAEMTRISDVPAPADTPEHAGELAAIETPLDPALVSEAFQGELGDRLVQAIRLDMNSAEIRITPEDLGPIQIDLNMNGDTANISFSADHGATRQALQDSMQTLRDMLSSEGWTLGQADVRDNPSNGQMGDRRSADGDRRGNRSGSASDITGEAAVQESRYLPPRRPQSLVDLFA